MGFDRSGLEMRLAWYVTLFLIINIVHDEKVSA